MRVTKMDGAKYIVVINCKQGYDRTPDFIVNSKARSWDGLDIFNDDLTGIWTDNTIVKVEIPKHPYDLFNVDSGEYITIWERKEPIPMTLADIEKELGYPVKIIENKEGQAVEKAN